MIYNVYDLSQQLLEQFALYDFEGTNLQTVRALSITSGFAPLIIFSSHNIGQG